MQLAHYSQFASMQQMHWCGQTPLPSAAQGHPVTPAPEGAEVCVGGQHPVYIQGGEVGGMCERRWGRMKQHYTALNMHYTAHTYKPACPGVVDVQPPHPAAVEVRMVDYHHRAPAIVVGMVATV